MSAVDHVQPDALEWALTHLLKYGDTDLLPIPFEYQAVKADWQTIRPKLERRDLCTPLSGAAVHFLVPKPTGTFRVVTRLDPLDAILYTAATYECAALIEVSRAAPTIACSYRIDTTANGRFFAIESPWDAWTTRSVELLAASDVTHVVVADISDFYAQISHHRVCNALENAGVRRTRAQSIEKMLGGWSALQSRGLPVGPQASIILAEACINDVDQHLASRGYRHVRYVDDFRIFCRSYAEAIRAVHDLCDYLFTSHRLALQPSKTRTYKKATFASQVLENPEFLEQRRKKAKIDAVVHGWHELGYSVSEEDIDASEIKLDVLVELFGECIKHRPLKLGLARHLFRRAAYLRTNRIQKLTLDNLVVLAPVLRDAVLYLQKAKQAKSATRVADRLLKFGIESDYSFLPYLQEWIVDALTSGFLDACKPQNLLKLAQPAKAAMGLRGEALIAKARGDIAWVRQYKERWRNCGPWDRRAVIWAGSALKDDERHAWRKVVLASEDTLDRAVAISALK